MSTLSPFSEFIDTFLRRYAILLAGEKRFEVGSFCCALSGHSSDGFSAGR
jgi:hypothetical protein